MRQRVVLRTLSRQRELAGGGSDISIYNKNNFHSTLLVENVYKRKSIPIFQNNIEQN